MSTTNSSEKKSIYQIIYEDDVRMRESKWAIRPATFSFNNIKNLREVRLLVMIATLVQTAQYLNIDEDHPQDDKKIAHWPMVYYIYGSSLGLIALALYSNAFKSQHMLFLPIMFTTCMLLLFLVTCFVVARILGGIDNPNEILLAIEGFFEAQVQFYILFLTPLRIADKYRLT